jgi:hypothetical protein
MSDPWFKMALRTWSTVTSRPSTSGITEPGNRSDTTSGHGGRFGGIADR